jgi:hypothetical protein
MNMARSSGMSVDPVAAGHLDELLALVHVAVDGDGLLAAHLARQPVQRVEVGGRQLSIDEDP